MRHLGFAAVFVLAPASLAGATGGYYCAVEDANLTFSADGELSRFMGQVLLGSYGKIEIKAEGVPEGFRTLNLDDALVHHWFYGRDLWLHYHAEIPAGPATASLNLVVRTEFDEVEMTYNGDYLLSVFAADSGAPIDLTGPITCEME